MEEHVPEPNYRERRFEAYLREESERVAARVAAAQIDKRKLWWRVPGSPIIHEGIDVQKDDIRDVLKAVYAAGAERRAARERAFYLASTGSHECGSSIGPRPVLQELPRGAVGERPLDWGLYQNEVWAPEEIAALDEAYRVSGERIEVYSQAVSEGYSFDDLTLEEFLGLPPDQMDRALTGYHGWVEDRTR